MKGLGGLFGRALEKRREGLVTSAVRFTMNGSMIVIIRIPISQRLFRSAKADVTDGFFICVTSRCSDFCVRLRFLLQQQEDLKLLRGIYHVWR